MTTETTEEIQRLIARLTVLKGIAIGAALLALTAGAVAVLALSRSRPSTAPAGPAILDASELTVRDQDGNVRGRWSIQGLSLVDKTGRVRAGMTVSDAGAPNLTLFSKSGGVRAVIGLGSGDSPGITLHDEKSRVRTRIIVGTDDVPSVLISDQNGDVIGRLPAPAATPRVTARRDR